MGKSMFAAQSLVIREAERDYIWPSIQWQNHVGSTPDVMFTDTDDAAANAMAKVFKGKTNHFWCI